MAKMETAYLAGGCFWCITPTFKEMEGVTDVVSGYSGGDEVNPTYKDVKEQKTGHRETIRIDFDADTADFEEIFDIFLRIKQSSPKPTIIATIGAKVSISTQENIAIATNPITAKIVAIKLSFS